MLAAGFVLAAVALLLLAGATTPARAADDLVSDGVLAVGVRDSGDGSALAAAEVRVSARRDGQKIGVRGALTGSDGSAAFDGLPRALAGSPITLGGSARLTLTPPPTEIHVQPGPAHKLLPGWGWVVLGMICFAVVLGLAWPDHRDRG